MKKLTAYNKDNDRQIEMMMGKAMCAYANWQRSIDKNCFFFKSGTSDAEKERARVAHQSEYEATIRCIDMFVKESIYEIQQAITDSCKEELGI